MKLPSYFGDFLSEIRLSPDLTDELKTGHKTLRELLEKDNVLSDILVTTFLQGSYRRSTIIRPKNEADKLDVDIIVVTDLDKDKYKPDDAFKLFIPFLEEHYPDYIIQGRSIGISLDRINIDLVITTAPSEAEKNLIQKMDGLSDLSIDMFNEHPDLVVKSAIQEIFAIKQDSPQWTMEPLYIPDREANDWKPTHPLEQIRWTFEKNKNTNGHYVNVVKALKWWRKENYPDFDQPKSYPFEHFIGECCRDGVESVAEGVTVTLEKIKLDYKTKPVLEDHGVPDHDVFGRLSEDEYNRFYSQVCIAADVANEAFESKDPNESAIKWKELFGDAFPDPPQEKESSGYSRRSEKSRHSGGRYA
ncbi:MAG: SMODS domain-containing nucleotidyltransferase [Methanobacterium sp.]|jgi:hypothetical protein